MNLATGRLGKLLDREKALACQTGKMRQVRSPDGTLIAIITVSTVRDREAEESNHTAEELTRVAFVHLTKAGDRRVHSPWSPLIRA